MAAATMQMGLRSLRSVASHASCAQRQALLARPQTASFGASAALKRMSRTPAVLRAAYETAAAPGAPPTPNGAAPRVYADYAIYKGKGALCLKAIKPDWTQGMSGGLSVNRPGVMLLEFAAVDSNAGAQSSYGNRSYNWDGKQTFALSAAELGNFIVSDSFQLFHDPNKGRSNDGAVTKTLKVSPMTDGTGGAMINFTVKDAALPNGQFFLTVPISGGEMAVLKSVANYMIPRILGFDEVFARQEA